MAKKKKIPTSASKKQEAEGQTKTDPAKSPSDLNLDETSTGQDDTKTFPFKNSASYEGKKISKKKNWKNLKTILSMERSLPWSSEPVLYNGIEAPPSFRPAKKYSDLSGLLAKYTDPQTQLRYNCIDEYQTIQTLPSDIVAGYLTLRKAANPVG